VSNTTKSDNVVGPSSKWEPTTTIGIRRSTWKRLQKYHRGYGSSFDSAINFLIDEKERIIDSDLEEEQKNLGEFKI
jgi:hypothetical protein